MKSLVGSVQKVVQEAMLQARARMQQGKTAQAVRWPSSPGLLADI